ncbi:MAG: type II secretion system protein GspM [Legionellaceae bacterium]|nr:type II secretion system protein GspM [Legionellaceae bacterium]
MKGRWFQFWDGLNERERRALGLGLIGMLFYVSYAIYAPLKRAVSDNTKVLFEKRTTLTWIKSARSRFVPQQKGPEVLEGSKGLTIFSEALSKASFHDVPYQLQQMTDGVLQLSFDSVPYNPFLQWLWSMEQRYAMTIQTFNLERTDTPGLVRLTIIVSL